MTRYFYPALYLTVFVFVALRAWLIPLAHDEVATFYFYIQPGEFMPFNSHVDANGHFLTNLLGWLCFKIFGSAPLSLRLPSVAAFMLLCYATSRFRSLFSSRPVGFLFTASFLLVFTFLAYFSLCRGYGIGMACLVLSAFYFFSYMSGGHQRHFIKFVLFIQLGLAASLTLLFVVAIFSLFCLVSQIRRRSLLRPGTIVAWLLHAALMVYWTFYAFFLKENGALYYGQGESYWNVTFVSLIENLFGSHRFVQIALVAVLTVTVAITIVNVALKKFLARENVVISVLLLGLLIVSFYVLKKTLGVNYPQDRTGLFFYVFFVCAFCFFLDRIRLSSWTVVVLFLVLTVPSSAAHLDLRNHPWVVYETIPQRFFDLLVNEQGGSKERITIAGHRVREFNYGFENYRSPVKLNHMTSPEALQMNCDYAVAVKADRPWYDPYYDEMATDERWGYRLLKRKSPITRMPLLVSPQPVLFQGEQEYFNCFEIMDTLISESGPLQADVDFRVIESPDLLRAWFVFQIDAEDPNETLFMRAPLDLMYGSWKDVGDFRLSLVSPNMPAKIKRIVFYLWNMKTQPLKVMINSYRLSKLEGDGVTLKSKAKL